MSHPEYITVQDLYAFAKEMKLLDARIRICDGMAVSYYPDPRAVSAGRYEIIIDISANTPVEFDELDEWAQRQYANDRAAENHRFQRDSTAESRREYIRRRQSQFNAGTDPDSVPWSIYGYGPYRRRK